jgi:hypothetical protein
MQMSSHPIQRRRRLIAVVVLSALVGLGSAALATDTIELLPPKLKSSEPHVSAATTHVFVDSQSPSIVNRRALPQDVDTLVKHGELLGRVMVTPPVLRHIARHAHVAQDRIAAVAPPTFGPRALTDAGSEQRAAEIHHLQLPYRLEVQPRQTTPIIDIYAQAPSTEEAVRLANAGVLGLREYLAELGRRQGFKKSQTLRLRQLGTARGAIVNGGAPLSVAVLTFVFAFALSCGAGMLFLRVRERGPVEGRALRGSDHADDAAVDDNWPRTTRVLPWTLAGFIAVLWLVPFDAIELSASLPVDLKFDRLVLPIVVAAFVLAFVVGGRARPRWRLTWIHAAVGAFMIVAFLSVILNARALNQTLEFDLSLKKIPLLLAYLSAFAIAASAVRRSEVRAFLNYTLILAVVCAVGILYEFRFKQNLFYNWSDQLPGFFRMVAEAEAGAVDEAGRRLVRGPAAAPLEAVAMLSMALPIALIGLMQAKAWGGRLLHAVAACLLLAAMFATYRKSALLAPVSVVLTLAYFRRRELLRLAPLALVLVIVIQLLAPGALRMTTFQFEPNQLGVPTVNDRTVDYDAVRPDVWTHLVIGRGWGSYPPTGHRILDNELLLRTVETGILGLLTFLALGVSVILSARKTITSRDPVRSAAALAGAAAAVAFLVMSTLFDVLSFPHATYIFLYMAGLVAVVIDPAWRPEPVRAAPDLHAVRRHGHQPAPPARRPVAEPVDALR